MGYIKNLRIIGFKKFKDFSINFNPGTNVLVGENQSGKSTIIEAIDLVINKIYEKQDRYILAELFTKENVESFIENPSFETLPSIDIIAEFELKNTDKFSSEYYGINWKDTDKKTHKYGVWFRCSVEKDIEAEVSEMIHLKNIPYEYYSLTWRTFKNEPYNRLKKTIKFVPIDSSNNSTFNSIDFYSKRLFMKKYEERLTQVKSDFRTHIDTGFDELKLDNLDEKQKFVLNHKRLILENIVGIKEDDILIENKGKGEEKIIKTNLSLADKQNNNVIAIEEPENNLSHSNLRKLINDIEDKCDGKQLLITTHSNLIVTGLSLENVLWISRTDKNSLKDLDKDRKKDKTSDYFRKLENDNLLRFILANKVVLVEGPTEHVLLPYVFEKEYGISIDSLGIDIISCNGLSFKRYIDVAKVLDKKVAVFTDNDGSKDKINYGDDFNKNNKNIRIFMPSDESIFTWEVALKNCNSDFIERIINLNPKAKYKVNGRIFEDKYLAYMLNNKVNISLKIVSYNEKIILPKHLEDLFKWIKE